MFKKLMPAAIAATTLLLPAIAQAQGTRTYAGNGASGFGGTLGNGSLTVSSSASNGGSVTFTLNPSGSFTSNDVVIYIDSVSGGFADTSQFTDNGDGGREAVSGYNSGNTPATQTVATFAPSFKADYAISMENTTFNGLFGLVAGGNNSLNYINGSAPSGATDSVTFTYANLGLTPGQTFQFVGTLISNSAYRSNETLGTSTTVPDNTGDSPNAGFAGTTTFSNSLSYTVAAAPEPSGVASLLIGAAVLGGAVILRRRRVA